jgi:cobalt-zinc-cadmium efflux system membrane fusion protein
MSQTMTGTLSIGLSGDPDDRTIDLFVVPDTLAPWARAGITSQLEIITDETAAPVLAVPNAAIQTDGLERVIFRRDPADPNRAIRLQADLGLSDGRWTAVNSGLRTGDEVVLDGAFQLMLASANAGQDAGGHFHADGTFHSGDDE